MKLTVTLPTGVLVDQEVTKVTAEAENGSFCLLPRHIDFLAALVPGLLSFEDEAGQEEFLAIDEGVLVKCGAEVMVSTRNAVRGAPLGQLRQAVAQRFRVLDERERQARAVLGKLEADLIGRFIRLGEKGRG
ncbi:MAG: F0F1 ATP synthase subunit epsilon [Deltaproteobacteria bacterium]|nr:F0F1 ATP synthase subunit epsilon [Deltaproteobacteria bacterium]